MPTTSIFPAFSPAVHSVLQARDKHGDSFGINTQLSTGVQQKAELSLYCTGEPRALATAIEVC
jgi:hypothetical protein